MIDPQLAAAGSAMVETLEQAPELLPKLVPLFAAGIIYAQRQMVIYLLDHETDWPWSA